jgi:2-polyprenyl-3-methyl-5-hydroxy-6-metoxy-1,4-benzoquinol methylase
MDPGNSPGAAEPTGSVGYSLTRSAEELSRLSLQDALVRPSTVSLFRRAGIGEGMRVLDVGSGAGDVALTVAGMVGSTGSVVGVELDGPTAEATRRRLADAGAANVEILAHDIATFEPPGTFDAIVGRFVLMHLEDPATILVRLRASLRDGGLVVFQEPHLAYPWISFPDSATLDHVQGVRARANATGRSVYAHMGLALRGVFLHAGLPDPELTAEAMVGGGPGWPGYRYIEETARGLLDMWKRVGAQGAQDVVVEGMAERIEREVGDTGSVFIHTMVGAWAAAPAIRV